MASLVYTFPQERLRIRASLCLFCFFFRLRRTGKSCIFDGGGYSVTNTPGALRDTRNKLQAKNMMILAILSDGGQNYIEFDIACGFIQEVRPSLLAGWKGTKVRYGVGVKCESTAMELGTKQKVTMTTDLGVGGGLFIQLHNGYELTLKYPIREITGSS